ncbi:MAG: hypothetical protein P4L69_10980 [Desulfosporosinus sp.]|nr:hypothetical protein [Desulfosporosinus sp.]
MVVYGVYNRSGYDLVKAALAERIVYTDKVKPKRSGKHGGGYQVNTGANFVLLEGDISTPILRNFFCKDIIIVILCTDHTDLEFDQTFEEEDIETICALCN